VRLILYMRMRSIPHDDAFRQNHCSEIVYYTHAMHMQECKRRTQMDIVTPPSGKQT